MGTKYYSAAVSSVTGIYCCTCTCSCHDRHDQMLTTDPRWEGLHPVSAMDRCFVESLFAKMQLSAYVDRTLTLAVDVAIQKLN